MNSIRTGKSYPKIYTNQAKKAIHIHSDHLYTETVAIRYFVPVVSARSRFNVTKHISHYQSCMYLYTHVFALITCM